MSSRKLAKNTILLGVSTLVNKGLMFIMIPFFTRWVSVEDYGNYDVITTYVMLLIPIITLSSSNAVFRLSVDKDNDQKRDYITNGLALVLVNYAFASIILSLINVYFGLEAYVPFMVLLFSEVLDNYFQGYLRAIRKLPILGVCKMMSTICGTMMIVIFVKQMEWGLIGLIYGYACIYALDVVLIVLVTGYWNYVDWSRLSIKTAKELVTYSWVLIPNDICWWIINVSDRKIINLFLGPIANGIYAVAYKMPNLCSATFGVFNISWQEAAADSLEDDNRNDYYNKILNTMITVLLSLCIGIMACNFLFFDFVFDSRFSSARYYTPILTISVLFNTLSLFYGGIQISLKNPKANGISTIAGAFVNVLVHLLLIRPLGLYAAAVSTLLSSVVVMYIRKALLIRTYKFTVLKRQFLLVFIYLYFALMGILHLPLIVNVINLLGAAVLFLVVNKKLILNMTRRKNEM